MEMNLKIEDESKDNSVDLYDEALVRDINYQMTPFDSVEEDEKMSFHESPSQSSPDHTDRIDRKKLFQFYVGNLTWWTNDEDLAGLIGQLGVNDLLDIRIFDKRSNGQSKGFCQVAVGSERSFRICMQKVPGQVLNGNSLVTAPFTKQWYSHFDNIASVPASQFKNQKLEPLQASPNVCYQSFSVESENPCIRPVSTQPKPGFPSNNSNPLPPQQLPARMPLWPQSNRLGPPCPPATLPPRRFPMPVPNGPSYGNMPPIPPGPPIGPLVTNQWRCPPKSNSNLQQQPQQALPPSNWPRDPSPHHAVFHSVYPQPPPHMTPTNPTAAPLYARPPPFNRYQSSTMLPASFQPPPSKKLCEDEENDTIVRNEAVSNKALVKAVSDLATGNHSSAVETLTTAIELIWQSKMSRDKRSQMLVSTLSDMLHAVQKNEREMNSSKRSTDAHYSSPPSHAGTSRSYGRRKRSRSASRPRGSASRSPSLERNHRDRKDDGRDSDRGDRYRGRERERRSDRERTSTSSKRRSDRSPSRTRCKTTQERDRDHECRRSYDRDPSKQSKNPSPSLSPDQSASDWGHRRRD